MGIIDRIRTSIASMNARQPVNANSQVDLLSEIEGELVRLYGLTQALDPELGNLHDLPDELCMELSVSKIDELDHQVATVINAYGGEATLDQILVGLYRKFSASKKRRFMQNKLYRMDCVWSVPDKKGVYSTRPPTTQEASHG